MDELLGVRLRPLDETQTQGKRKGKKRKFKGRKSGNALVNTELLELVLSLVFLVQL